jgi:hypothetical protein
MIRIHVLIAISAIIVKTLTTVCFASIQNQKDMQSLMLKSDGKNT